MQLGCPSPGLISALNSALESLSTFRHLPIWPSSIKFRLPFNFLFLHSISPSSGNNSLPQSATSLAYNRTLPMNEPQLQQIFEVNIKCSPISSTPVPSGSSRKRATRNVQGIQSKIWFNPFDPTHCNQYFGWVTSLSSYLIFPLKANLKSIPCLTHGLKISRLKV